MDALHYTTVDSFHISWIPSNANLRGIRCLPTEAGARPKCDVPLDRAYLLNVNRPRTVNACIFRCNQDNSAPVGKKGWAYLPSFLLLSADKRSIFHLYPLPSARLYTHDMLHLIQLKKKNLKLQTSVT